MDQEERRGGNEGNASDELGGWGGCEKYGRLRIVVKREWEERERGKGEGKGEGKERKGGKGE